LLIVDPVQQPERQLALFDKVHPDYGAGVRAALRAHSTSQHAAE